VQNDNPVTMVTIGIAASILDGLMYAGGAAVASGQTGERTIARAGGGAANLMADIH